MHNIKQEDLEKLLEPWDQLLSKVYHEMGNQILNIRMKQQYLADEIPNLIEGYKLAVKHKLISKNIDIEDEIKDAINLEKELSQIKNIHTNLTDYSRELCVAMSSNPIPMDEYLNKLLASPTFANRPYQNLIDFNCVETFHINFPKRLLDTFFTTVLTNMLEKIDNNEQEVVRITITKCPTYNTVKIEAPFSEALELYLQESLNDLSTNLRNGEIGLGLCKLAIIHTGGELIQQKQSDESILLQLKFNNGFSNKDKF